MCAPDHFIWIAVLGASTVATSSDQCQLAAPSDLSRLGCAFEPPCMYDLDLALFVDVSSPYTPTYTPPRPSSSLVLSSVDHTLAL